MMSTKLGLSLYMFTLPVTLLFVVLFFSLVDIGPKTKSTLSISSVIGCVDLTKVLLECPLRVSGHLIYYFGELDEFL